MIFFVGKEGGTKPGVFKKEPFGKSDDEEILVDDFTQPEEKKKTKRCSRCENCLRTEDCDRCDVCHDRKKGLEGKMSKCRLRRCLNERPRKMKSRQKDESKREVSDKCIKNMCCCFTFIAKNIHCSFIPGIYIYYIIDNTYLCTYYIYWCFVL